MMRRRWWGRRPYVLATITWAYVAWSFLPVALAVALSVGYDPLYSTGSLDLSSYRAVFRATELRAVFVHSVVLAAATVMVAVPLGTAMGLGLAHLTRRRWRLLGGLLLVMIALPHLALGAAFFYLFLFVVRLPLDTGAQLIGHITVAIPFVVFIIWTRVLLLGTSYEEQAADLGAPPSSTVTRVLLPLCAPRHRSRGRGRVRGVIQRTAVKSLSLRGRGLPDHSHVPRSEGSIGYHARTCRPRHDRERPLLVDIRSHVDRPAYRAEIKAETTTASVWIHHVSAPRWLLCWSRKSNWIAE